MVAITTATHASESGHWYDSAGRQIEAVPNAKGDRQIAPTLKHARVLDLAPGVTTIIRCAAAPQLTEWMVGQGMMAALTLTRRAGESDADFLARVREDSKQHAAQAAEEGTRIHAAIQSRVQGMPVARDYEPHVAGVAQQLDIVCGVIEWRAELGCASRLGYGTKADMVGGRRWLIDWKGKDGDAAALAGMKTYDEHAMQLAATRNALAERGEIDADACCAIGFVSRTHPGACCLVGIAEDRLQRSFAMFRALLAYWQVKSDHIPTWATAAPGRALRTTA